MSCTLSSSCWNQTTIPRPATAAQKLDISKHPGIRKSLEEFKSDISSSKANLVETLAILDAEVLIFKRFLYKLTAVFIHDKSFKILKLIKKSITKFQHINVLELIKIFGEQHYLPPITDQFVHVAPKPVYEHLLLRTQGAVRLLAQVLCYSHNFGVIALKKLSKGHFINVNVLSMAFVARFWGLSLHIIQSLFKLHRIVKGILDQNILPDNVVQLLPLGHKFSKDLREWLLQDVSLIKIHDVLKPTEVSEVCGSRDDIWNNLVTENLNEQKHLMELKLLVEKKNDSIDANFNALESDTLITMDSNKQNNDIGELVSRGSSLPTNNKGRKKRTRKRKRMES